MITFVFVSLEVCLFGMQKGFRLSVIFVPRATEIDLVGMSPFQHRSTMPVTFLLPL